METNKKRFYDFWNSWLINKKSKILNATSLSEPKGLLKDTEGKMSLQNMWWVHRSWSSTIYYPSSQTNIEKLKQSPERAAFEFPLRGDRVLKAPDLIPVNLIYSIRPAQSLVVSSQLIVDYIADKIEQSVSIQQIFNEILRFFETEDFQFWFWSISPKYLSSISIHFPILAIPKYGLSVVIFNVTIFSWISKTFEIKVKFKYNFQ